MERAYKLWSEGISGSHHVWGKVELDRRDDIDVQILPHEKHHWINKVGRLFGITHLDQQIRILGQLRRFDILYAPYSLANLKFLLLLKIFGVFRKPIVVTIHQPFSKENQRFSGLAGYLLRKVFAQYEAAVFLSQPLLEKTTASWDLYDEDFQRRFSVTQWDPDLSYYERYTLKRCCFEECRYFVTAGHTDRDFETLIEAFRGLPYKLYIFCTPTSIPSTIDIPSNVVVDWSVTMSKDLIPYYQESIAILIPLKYPDYKEGCQGMTSIQDVLTFSKPTIITYNPCLNVDVEKEGIGISVPMYDIAAWKNAVQRLANNRELWEKFSEGSRRLFLEKVNSEIFANHMEKVFRQVYNEKVKS